MHYFVLFDQLEWQRSEGALRNLTSTAAAGSGAIAIGSGSERRATGAAAASTRPRRTCSTGGRCRAGGIWSEVSGRTFGPGPRRRGRPSAFRVGAVLVRDRSDGVRWRGGTDAGPPRGGYELLFTNRVILQPLVELEMFGKSYPARGIGAGVSSTDAGVRPRYDIGRREVAPYVGVTWSYCGGRRPTSPRQRAKATGGARLVTGMRRGSKPDNCGGHNH